jgi:radial spoke head protein 1
MSILEEESLGGCLIGVSSSFGFKAAKFDVLLSIVQDYVGGRSEKGRRNGFGRALLPTRSQYEGEYKDGLRHGRGTYQFANGTRYEGEYKEGQRHGKGRFNYLDGSWYEGDWKRGKKHGFGKYFYANGDTYEGGWGDEMKHGVGVYKFSEVELTIKGGWWMGFPIGPVEIIFVNFRFHGFWNKKKPVGDAVFTFGRRFMMPGHIDLFSNLEQFGAFKMHDIDIEAGPEELKCLPRFIAHDVEVYDESKVPHNPMPADSFLTVSSSKFPSSSMKALAGSLDQSDDLPSKTD